MACPLAGCPLAAWPQTQLFQWTNFETSPLHTVTYRYIPLQLFQLTNFNAQDVGQVLYNGELVAFTLLGVICGL